MTRKNKGPQPHGSVHDLATPQLNGTEKTPAAQHHSGDGKKKRRHGYRARWHGNNNVEAPKETAPPNNADDSRAKCTSKRSNKTFNRRPLEQGGSGSCPITMRQLYHLARLGAVRVMEQAAALLGVKPEGVVEGNDAKAVVATPSLNDALPPGATPGGLSGQSPIAPFAPSTHFLMAAVTRFGELLSSEGGRAGGAATTGLLPVGEITLLCELITWYCLETAATMQITLPSGGSLGVRSQGGSGRVTPAAAVLRRGHSRASATPAHLSTPLASPAPGTVPPANDRGDVQSWLGSRMSREVVTAVLLPDDQLAQQLLRPAVDAVVLFSTYNDTAATSGAVELRVSTLTALCAVLCRFPEAGFHFTTFMPMLFPEEDVRSGPHVRHPLLTPLLWDSSLTARSVAALLLVTLLHKLQMNLQYAEEPRHTRQSFVSLATQGGAALASIHDALHWALSQEDSRQRSLGRGGARRTRDAANADGNVPLLLHIFSTLSVVTPYNRCPHSLGVILDTLDLPVLKRLLRAEEGPAYSAVTAFLASTFKNESLRSHTSPRLLKATTEGHHRDDPLIADLLVHAKDRVEVWRCLVEIARFYPSLIQQHFIRLLNASAEVAVALLHQEEVTQDYREDPPSLPAPQSAGVPGGCGAAALGDALLHTDPTPALPTPLLARRKLRPGSPSQRQALASPEAFAECLHAWVHFMGYAWKAFDNNPSDPALQSANYHADRATFEEKTLIFESIIAPALRLNSSPEVYAVALRCVAQVGDAFMRSAKMSGARRRQLVEYVLSATEHWSTKVRGEALTTLGMWVWQYPSLDAHCLAFVESALAALAKDTEGVVRAKAVFALSNATSRLSETDNAVRASDHHMDQLCFAAMQAVTDADPAVQGHGIRMINHLLQVLTFEELIAELPNLTGEEECVAEGFLHILLRFLNSGFHEAKHRWNAACALGMALARAVVIEVEPRYAMQAVEALMTAVVRDRIFKVRAQAAQALGRIAPECWTGRFTTSDLSARVVRTLCVALGNAKATENFSQFKEQGALREALHATLHVMITTAAPTAELDKVFAEYRQVLVAEGLL